MKKSTLVLSVLFSTSLISAHAAEPPVKKIGTAEKATQVAKIDAKKDAPAEVIKEDPSLELSETVNPYTGVRAAIEKKKLLIDNAQLEMDLAKKKFDLGKEKYLLENKDKLYKKDFNDKLGLNIPGSSAPSQLANMDLDDIPSPKGKGKKGFGFAGLQPVQPMPSMLPPAPVIPANQLLGIMNRDGVKNAVMQINGNVVTVTANSTVNGQSIGEITDNSAQLNGQKLTMAATSNTFSNPDKQTLANSPSASGQGGSTLVNNQQVETIQAPMMNSPSPVTYNVPTY